ncbi:MAG: YHS domain-containing protein [Acidobacteriia bacterium]|nr:YHS domain-containing protein [Terriglobia bacterium]
MFRVIFYLLLAVILISVFRAVVGVVARGFSELVNPGANRQGRQSAANQVPLTGELKKDPTCGTYIATATSIKETVGGETFHFCSKQCRDKFVASMAR